MENKKSGWLATRLYFNILIYYLTINVYLKSRPLTYIFAYTTVKNSIKVSDSLISIFFIIFIGIVNLLSFLV